MTILVATDEWDVHDYAMAKWLQSLPTWGFEQDGKYWLILVDKVRPSRSRMIHDQMAPPVNPFAALGIVMQQAANALVEVFKPAVEAVASAFRGIADALEAPENRRRIQLILGLTAQQYHATHWYEFKKRRQLANNYRHWHNIGKAQGLWP
jgi:hypothetical protein